MGPNHQLSALLRRTSELNTRLDALYAAVRRTAQDSRELCVAARDAQVRARRLTSGER